MVDDGAPAGLVRFPGAVPSRRVVGYVIGLKVPQAIFGKEPFYGEWMDTSESQSLLTYQRHSLAETVRELGDKLRIVKWLLFPLRPIAPLVLTRIFRPS